MSFFNDTKNAGLLLIIIAVLSIALNAIALFVLDDYKDSEVWKKIVVLVGSVIGAIIYAILGIGIKNGKCMIQIGDFFSDVSSKFGVLVAITAGVGFADLVSSIFSLVAFGGMSVLTIVVAILMIVMAWFMINGDKLTGNVIWIILLILYILGIIGAIITIIALIGIPLLLLYILLLTFLLSPEVKSKMGMN